MSLIVDADRQYAHALGAERPEHAWILSDRDVWYPNPFYCGPAQPHPEDYDWYADEEVTEADLIRSIPYAWGAVDDEIPY